MVRRLIGVIGVFALTLVLFAPFIFRGQIPIPASYMLSWYEPWKSLTTSGGTPTLPHKPVIDDAFRHLYPLRVLASNLIKQGQLPLWNPYNAAGTPLLAIMHPGYLTPFGIFFFFLPPSLAWAFYLMLSLVLVGLAMYWYMRTLNVSPRAAFFAAAVTMLSGFVVVRLEYGEFLYVLSGLPVLLGIVECRRNNPGDPAILAVPLVVSFMLLSGQPHMIVYSLGVFALYALSRLPFGEVLRMGALSLLGVGMSAIQLLPSVELYRLSTITHQTSEFIFDRFLLPWWHLITLFVPNYFGNQATYNYFGPHDYTETIAYVGSIPIVLACLALLKTRSRVVTFFAVLAVVSVLSTLNWIGARLLFSLPLPVLSSDVPSRVFVLTTISVAVLSGIGYAFWEKHLKNSYRPLWIAGAVSSLLLLVTFIIYRLHIACPTLNIPQCRTVSLRTTLIEVAIFTAFLGTSVGISHAKGALRRFLLWAPIALVVAIGLYNAQKFLPFSPRESIFPDVPVLSSLRTIAGIDRFFGIGNAHIRSNVTTIYNVFSPEYFDPLHVRRYAELVSFADTGDKEKGITRSDALVTADATPSAEIAARRERFFDIASVKYLLFAKREVLPPRETLPLWQDASWYIVSRPTALPRVYVVYDYEVGKDDEILSRLFDPAFDVQNKAIIEGDPHVLPSKPLGSRVGIVRYEPLRVELSVVIPAQGILVLTDTYYPGWRAFVDGKESPLYRTNYTFRAVVVPQGTHTVRFIYQPQSVRWGAIVSGISLVVWLGIFLLLRA